MSLVVRLHPGVSVIRAAIRRPFWPAWNKLFSTFFTSCWSSYYMYRCSVVFIWIFITTILYLKLYYFFFTLNKFKTVVSHDDRLPWNCTWAINVHNYVHEPIAINLLCIYKKVLQGQTNLKLADQPWLDLHERYNHRYWHYYNTLVYDQM